MSVVVWVVVGVLVVSVLIAGAIAVLGRAAKTADQDEAREVFARFGRVGRRSGERRTRRDRRQEPPSAVQRERRRGGRRRQDDRRDPQSPRDDTVDPLL